MKKFESRVNELSSDEKTEYIVTITGALAHLTSIVVRDVDPEKLSRSEQFASVIAISILNSLRDYNLYEGPIKIIDFSQDEQTEEAMLSRIRMMLKYLNEVYAVNENS